MEVVVNVQQGGLRGKVVDNLDGGQYTAFRGIPFAKSPIGPLRFKDPVPPERWSGIRDAFKYGDKCAQYDIITRQVIGSEDCLYLNVYTTDVKPATRMPVMVWIHGGGFYFGSGDDEFYGPDYLVNKGVVVVTINYRLGVFGFLNLAHEAAPGNQGLKDQVMALRWVQENISNFGGDPDNVTIFGESAGGAAVHYITLSPLADGLYHKAIMQSGCATCPWAHAMHDQLRYGLRVSAMLGLTSVDPAEVVEFLRTVDAKEMVKVEKRLVSKEELAAFIIPFPPGADNSSPQPFMPLISPITMRRGVHVPLLIGHNSDEGGVFAAKVQDDFYEVVNKNFEKILHPHTAARIKNEKIPFADIKRLYFGEGDITKDNVMEHFNLLGDVMFLQDIYETVRVQMEKGTCPTYLYKFSYPLTFSLMKTVFQLDVKGAVHADDLLLLFYPHMLKNLGQEGLEPGTRDYKLMQQMTQMWTDFAKTGNPTPAQTELIPEIWQPLKAGDIYDYMQIDDELKMQHAKKSTQRFEWPSMRNKL